MEPIEWIFTIISFASFYFFVSKKAGEAKFRIIGLLLSIVINILVSIFSFSIGVLSIGIINACYVFLTSIGIINCYLEIKNNRIKLKSELPRSKQ